MKYSLESSMEYGRKGGMDVADLMVRSLHHGKPGGKTTLMPLAESAEGSKALTKTSKVKKIFSLSNKTTKIEK